ncbi:PspC domain-containing protein [Corynebacterium guangdongense]|uniref:Phage shock protein PspC (Stress-responsive transcriptional regulator) n=1 Tax=Corynebacterium guangdongense TaxID=1783348 RepID=A0ABU1ZUJ0_9CORY|nr:PspC domain-containing protein [Corynebacterium guangdongense]MDR7328596.1 phage shock protein PspC (stress-responsive transcriptional regulator) [Corynebacterium guangdongense]WJZ17173.1 PspC domain protein [Corynebacterium guangdongense]
MSTLNDMWATRPPRIPENQGGNAKVAGVCEGIGVRYQIDPTIVRIAFVVATLSVGGGIAAYLLAWGFMPRYGMKTSPIEACFRRSEDLDPVEKKERPTGWWLMIGFIFFSGFLFSMGSVGSTTLIALLLLAAAWFALHHRLPVPPEGVVAQNVPATAASGPVDLSAYSFPEGYEQKQTPPSWDPLGTAPFAWDLPDPPARETPKKRKPRIWPWLIGGFAVVLMLGATVLAWVDGRNGLVYVDDAAMGDVTRTVQDESQLADAYEASIGNIDLDLSDLPRLEEDHRVKVATSLGDIDVTLPEDVPVELTCDTALGTSNCTPGSYNDDAAGRTLTLHIENSIGDVEVLTPTR